MNSPIHDQLASQHVELDHRSHGRLVRLYQVSVRVFEDQRAHTQLMWLDMGLRRMITEELGCVPVGDPSRRAALQTLLDAVADAIVDTAEGSRVPF